MKNGSSMSVRTGASSKGVLTTDTYSLGGISAALEKIGTTALLVHKLTTRLTNSRAVRTRQAKNLIRPLRRRNARRRWRRGRGAEGRAHARAPIVELDLCPRRARFRRHDESGQGFPRGMAARFTLARPEIVTEQISDDGTRKWLLRSRPGHRIRNRVHSRSRAAARCASPPRSAAR